MDDDKKNLIITVLLSGLVLFGWQFYFAPPPPDPALQKQAETAALQQQDNGEISQPSLTAPGNNLESADQPLQIGSDIALGLSKQAALEKGVRIPIKNGRIAGSINLIGGRIDDMILADYRETLDENSPQVTLLNPLGTSQPYYIDYGMISSNKNIKLPDQNSQWQASANQLTPAQPLTLTWDNQEGLIFSREYQLDDNYMVSITQSVQNNTSSAIDLAPYGLVSRTGQPETLGFYILHEGLIGFLNDSLEEIDYDDVIGEAPITQESTGGWLGITDKYWLVALIPDQTQPITTRFAAGTRGNQPLFQTDFLMASKSLSPGGSANWISHSFIGAKETTLLDQYVEELGIEKFDLAVDFGWFYFLTKPIFLAIHWLHSILGNFGLAILALTVCIKTIFFPLANKSYVSMSRMKLLQPKMQELKEKFGDDRMKFQQEMMALYKKEKVNPMSGCLPILVQIPVFFALYKVLFVTIEMRQAPFYGWISDLSAPDPLGILTLFGLIDWSVPQALSFVNIGIWPLIMGLTMWLQQKLNPTPPDPIQAKIFMLMPIIFTFILAPFPAGLVIYWAWNNLLSITQQRIIMSRVEKENRNKKAK